MEETDGSRLGRDGFALDSDDDFKRKFLEMKTFEEGQYVSIPCHIQKGAFSIERLVTVETKEGLYSGFVREECLWQDGDKPDGYIPGVIQSVDENTYTLGLPGEWFISGMMDFTADWIQENANLLQLKESAQMQPA